MQAKLRSLREGMLREQERLHVEKRQTEKYIEHRIDFCLLKLNNSLRENIFSTKYNLYSKYNAVYIIVFDHQALDVRPEFSKVITQKQPLCG